MAKSKNSKQQNMDLDLALALELQQDYNPIGITENAVYPKDRNKENYKPRTLIDQTLEIIDPTPNIYTLFMQFNSRFFYNKLLSVEVKWSTRMTSCAGICTFRPRSKDCVISLSAPLLKLRPRKDLVETLLHEMIHGYLFLTNNRRDRDGHGPEFCKHMDRINKEAGTHITIYHTFHDEVKLYQQHWWRCNGPCQKQHPYFGMVRRAMNRAPGPSDFWWSKHQQNCGGQFIKVREPEKPVEKSKSEKATEGKRKPSASVKGKNDRNLDDFFTKPQVKSKPATTSNVPKASTNFKVPKASTISPKSTSIINYQPNIDTSNIRKNYKPSKSSAPSASKVLQPGLVKLGTSTNNVHGWGTGGPGSSSEKSPNISKNKIINDTDKSSQAMKFTGTVGGRATGRSNLLDKFSPSPNPNNKRSLSNSIPIYTIDSPSPKKPKLIENPTATVRKEKVNLDDCIEINSSPEKSPGKATKMKIQTNLDGFLTSPEKRNDKFVSCPVCDKSIEFEILNVHLDNCLTENENNGDEIEKEISVAGSTNGKYSNNFVDLTDEKSVEDSYVCLVCNARISADIALNDHLDECVQAIFNESTDDDNDENFIQNSESSSPEASIEKDKFPCPICMEPIPEENMNEHLDLCLSGDKWD